ncbi:MULTISPECIES: inorganic diphosphatase [unclassified Uliginosibacterium]|uniref:inorganic diphosphatase n=1 Tax=unclassified Uliginosibacterium TaxID=2621521 RepID=UPI000C7A8A17|nr:MULTISPECIES: inorganic diphosphatase [unclassified Uliginosibacterium]MDO6384719.1 inorganic diphosphatase [Uliginosibacterium sp. 31-12]PLK48415.1 inorganic diphosphatase [Uliginosibacterium sp. TH139]
MGFNNVPPGNVPDDVNVIIEIPAHADPIKYEIDKDTGAVYVDRFMGTSMSYPCNYGYVPRSISGDGDPVDVLVMAPFALIPGVVIRCRPVGVLRMIDEAGEDAKVLAVPVPKITSLYDNIRTYQDLPYLLLRQIEHFFQHYKDLEQGKWVKVLGWDGIDAARQEIYSGVAAFNAKAGDETD